jgi:hypothetical protein
MNKFFIFGGILFLSMTSLDAREIGFRPRLNVGMMSYDYTKQANASLSEESKEGATGVFPSATSQWSASVESPILRSGFTLFVDRVFIDFDFQYAFDKNTKTSFSTWATLNQDSLPGLTADQLLRFDTRANIEFERTELALTLGYSLTDQLALYAGYKRADNNSTFDIDGDVLAVQADNLTVNPAFTDFTTLLKQELVYQGPFLGATYTWNFNTPKLEGGLTGNIGIAFLDGITSNEGLKNFQLTGESGEPLPVDVATIDRPPFNLVEQDGDTVGISLALSWNGFTPIDGLMYSVGLNNYRYEFDDKNNQDFSIDILRFDAGINYTFDL